MDWILEYQLFLFDFDGILVDTECLHYRSYQLLCQEHGITLSWDWPTYARFAMNDANGLKKELYNHYPLLRKAAPNWELFYRRKKDIYLQLLQNEPPALIPGIATFLSHLQEASVKTCVVTHSCAEHVHWLRSLHPILNTIPHWITREQYQHPKPSSECYEKAISLLAEKEDKVIGFEDSPRGLTALAGTRALPVFVTDTFNVEERQALQNKIGAFHHTPNFQQLCQLGPRACF